MRYQDVRLGFPTETNEGLMVGFFLVAVGLCAMMHFLLACRNICHAPEGPGQAGGVCVPRKKMQNVWVPSGGRVWPTTSANDRQKQLATGRVPGTAAGTAANRAYIQPARQQTGLGPTGPGYLSSSGENTEV